MRRRDVDVDGGDKVEGWRRGWAGTRAGRDAGWDAWTDNSNAYATTSKRADVQAEQR